MPGIGLNIGGNFGFGVGPQGGTISGSTDYTASAGILSLAVLLAIYFMY